MAIKITKPIANSLATKIVQKIQEQNNEIVENNKQFIQDDFKNSLKLEIDEIQSQIDKLEDQIQEKVETFKKKYPKFSMSIYNSGGNVDKKSYISHIRTKSSENYINKNYLADNIYLESLFAEDINSLDDIINSYVSKFIN